MIVNEELEGMCEQTAVTYFETLSQERPGGTEEDYDVPQSALPISGLIFESEIFRVRSRSGNFSPAMFRLT
jgi:hypothetical protein